MDLRAIRVDLSTVAVTAGFDNAWSIQPDDPQSLPAAVVGGIISMERLNAIVTKIMLPITLYVNAADIQDATERLDLALSTGLPNSLIDCMDAVAEPPNTPSWRSIRFDSSGPYQKVIMPGGGSALSVETRWELTA